MAKYCLKKTSKRQSCAKRYKIEKKVRDHNRKVQKESKKLNKKGKKNAKTITVPKSCPFKEEILIEAEQARERIKAQLEARKEAATNQRAEKRKMTTPLDLEALAAQAAKQRSAFEVKEGESKELEHVDTMNDKTIKVYASEVRKTIESADIIIEVLDARDPIGSRCASVEEQVIKGGKRLVLLLNKIDLVPRENVQKWLVYLRGKFPTIAFKASTQDQKNKLGRFNSSNLNNSGTSKCIGADLLMKLLGNYCRNQDIRTNIRVGVVGYPNVGKSSVINSLKRKRACNVGAVPGITKEIQEIELDKHIRLLDSPGVVLMNNKDIDPIEVALKNAIRVDSLIDPVAPVHAILRRCSKETMMLHYTIPEYKSVDQFLSLVARKTGKLQKRARPDINAAARHVLNDWNTGRLRYYTQVPETASLPDETLGMTAEIVSQFSKEFDIDGLEEDQNIIVEGLPMDTDTAAPCNSDEEDEDDETDEEMEVDAASTTVVTSGKKKKIDNDEEEKVVLPTSLAIEGNVQLNRLIKKAAKNQKRKMKKTAQRADKLAESMNMATME